MLDEIASRPFRARLTIVAAGLLLVGAGSATLPLIDRDEPRFARATVEMMERGSWIVPWFNGAHRYDKPPLTYWLMRAGYAIAGVGELGARLHTMASAVAIALALFAMGRRWFSARAGLVAGVGFLSCLQVLYHGRMCIADLPMVLCVTLALWAVAELLGLPRGEPPAAARGWFWLLYLALGVGFLAKGPIAWIVPGLALLLFRFALHRRPQPWRRLRPAAGWPIALAIVAAWGVPALILTDGDFWRVGIGRHVIDRGLQPVHHRDYTPLFFALAFVPSLYPWSAWLPDVWRRFREGPAPLTAFLAAWFAAPYLLFSFYATQLTHYILPALPAYFLLLGAASDRAGGWLRTAPATTWRRLVLAAGGAASAGLILWAWRGTAPDGLHDLRVALAGFGVVGLGLTLLGWAAHGRIAIAPVAALVVGLGAHIFATGLRAVTPAIQLQQVFREMPPGARYGSYRFAETSLIFYSGRPWRGLSNREDVKAFLAEPGPALLVLQESAWKRRGLRLVEKQEPFRLKPEHRVGWNEVELTGWNIARQDAARLRVLYKTGAEPL